MTAFRSILICFCLLALVSGTFAAEPEYRKLYRQGIEFNKAGKLEKAIAAYSKAIALKPDAAAIYYVRGRAYRQSEELDKSIEDFSRAISLKPDYADAYNERGITYIGKGAKEKYLADFKKGCELKNNNACANLKKFK